MPLIGHDDDRGKWQIGFTHVLVFCTLAFVWMVKRRGNIIHAVEFTSVRSNVQGGWLLVIRAERG